MRLMRAPFSFYLPEVPGPVRVSLSVPVYEGQARKHNGQRDQVGGKQLRRKHQPTSNVPTTAEA